VHPRVVEYLYTWQGAERQGKKLECILLSADSDSYCTGIIKRTGSTGTADQSFKNSVAKFQEDTIWNMSRVTLVAEKPQFIGAPVKYVIDLAKTKVSPVLQSTTFPKTPTPPDSLATIVQLLRQQRVDFLAIVRSVANQRQATTSRGDRIIVDVTFMDGSKLENGKVATITTAMFFPRTKNGDEELQKLRDQDKPASGTSVARTCRRAAVASLRPCSCSTRSFARNAANFATEQSSGNSSKPMRYSAFAFSSATNASGALAHPPSSSPESSS
jgi:hypothetical protein